MGHLHISYQYGVRTTAEKKGGKFKLAPKNLVMSNMICENATLKIASIFVNNWYKLMKLSIEAINNIRNSLRFALYYTRTDPL